jgi:rsbT co-antagonist protein RsbR
MDQAELEGLRQRVLSLERQVAEQERTIEALRASESRLARLDEERSPLIAAVETSMDFIGFASLEGRALYVNPAGRRMVGLGSLEEVRCTVMADYVMPEEIALLEREIVPILLTEGRWEGELTFRHMPTGTPIPAHYSAFLVKDDRTGEPITLATVTRDLRSLKKADEERRRLQEELIRAQGAALAELSTPLIPISDRVVVMPLIGTLDSARAQRVLETLLGGVSDRGAEVAILDITGVAVVDTAVAAALLRAAKAVRLLGAEVVLTGIRPEVAQALVGLGVELGDIVTRSTLQSGIAFAMRRA